MSGLDAAAGRTAAKVGGKLFGAVTRPEGRDDDQVRQRALETMTGMEVPEEVRDFLDRWMRREFDVIG